MVDTKFLVPFKKVIPFNWDYEGKQILGFHSRDFKIPTPVEDRGSFYMG